MAKVKAKAEKSVPALKKNFWSNDRNVAYVLGGIAFLLYIQSAGFDYALDDRAVLFSNKYVTDGFGGFGKILSTFYWAGFWDSNAGLFRPISLLMYATEWQIFGNKPHVFHVIHTVLYAVLSMQLFLFLRRLFKEQNVTLPLLATLLWIVMPVHTEVGANLKSADEILSLLFSLLALKALLQWVDEQNTPALYFSCAWFFLALLSKEGAVLMLPVAMLMLYMLRKTEIRQLVKPGALWLGVSVLWFIYHTAVIANAPSDMITYDYHNNALFYSDSFITRLGTAIAIQGHYWVKMIVGYPMSYNYSFNEIPVNGFADAWSIISLVVIIGSVAWSFMNLRKNPVPAFGILFYFVSFALTSNIFYLIGETMGERLVFVPSVGFAIILAWALLKITKEFDGPGFKTKTLTAGIMLALLWSGLTFSRSKAWAYESTLFTEDVEHAPGSARVHYNYGVLLLGNAQDTKDEVQKQQLLNQAYEQFTIAFDIDSMDYQSCFNLGVVEYRRKNYRESVKWSSRVLQVAPTKYDVYENLGDAYLMNSKFDSAAYCYENYMDSLGQTAPMMIKLGNATLGKKDTAMAIEYYAKATTLDSASNEAWNKLGNLTGMNHQFDRSNKAFEKLAALNPNDPGPWKMLYTNYSIVGDSIRMQQAAQEYYKRGGK